ncbi:MAG: hypothetical protein M5R36_24850 [Deltaproteobacteria bacterium]|nr:hypothetical protein [Deltaproteobacteria bacterium]
MAQGKKSPGASALLAELEQAVTKAGYVLRYERLTQGPVRATHGSCRFQDRHLVIVDSRMRPEERADALLDELSRFDLDDVYLSPSVRDHLTKRRSFLGGIA